MYIAKLFTVLPLGIDATHEYVQSFEYITCARIALELNWLMPYSIWLHGRGERWCSGREWKSRVGYLGERCFYSSVTISVSSFVYRSLWPRAVIEKAGTLLEYEGYYKCN